MKDINKKSVPELVSELDLHIREAVDIAVAIYAWEVRNRCKTDEVAKLITPTYMGEFIAPTVKQLAEIIEWISHRDLVSVGIESIDSKTDEIRLRPPL